MAQAFIKRFYIVAVRMLDLSGLICLNKDSKSCLRPVSTELLNDDRKENPLQKNRSPNILPLVYIWFHVLLKKLLLAHEFCV